MIGEPYVIVFKMPEDKNVCAAAMDECAGVTSLDVATAANRKQPRKSWPFGGLRGLERYIG